MGKIIVEVCAGTYCTMMGSMDIVAAIESLVELKESGVECDLDIRVTPCLGDCQNGALAPVVRIDGEILVQAEAETIMSRLLERSKKCAAAADSAESGGH